MCAEITAEEVEDAEVVDTFFDEQEIPTAFTANIAEVKKALEDLKNSGVIVMYEFVQNILDYNDYEQGPPEIQVSLEDGRRLSFLEFAAIPYGEVENLQVAEVSFQNYIREGSYLTPNNLTTIEHEG